MELSNNSDGPVAQINIVPLVDIMLVLLVIFMVTAPMMQQGVDVNLPKAATGAMKGSSQEQVVLSVDQKGDVYLGAGNKIELAELGAKVGAVLARRPDDERKVFVKADSALSYGRVMEVMGALHAGGITQVGLVSAPPDKRP